MFKKELFCGSWNLWPVKIPLLSPSGPERREKISTASALMDGSHGVGVLLEP